MEILRFKGIGVPFDRFPKPCERCEKEKKRPDLGWDEIDLMIWHNNGHTWPGFAGEPDSGNYGGSDF